MKVIRCMRAGMAVFVCAALFVGIARGQRDAATGWSSLQQSSRHSWLPEAIETGTFSRARVWLPQRPRSQRARARWSSGHLSLVVTVILR